MEKFHALANLLDEHKTKMPDEVYKQLIESIAATRAAEEKAANPPHTLYEIDFIVPSYYTEMCGGSGGARDDKCGDDDCCHYRVNVEPLFYGGFMIDLKNRAPPSMLDDDTAGYDVAVHIAWGVQEFVSMEQQTREGRCHRFQRIMNFPRLKDMLEVDIRRDCGDTFVIIACRKR